MKSWRELAELGRWNLIDFINQPRDDQIELLEVLRETVPQVTDENGIEFATRHALPNELSDKGLKEAAQILVLGELEAAVDGDPPTASDDWAAMCAEIRVYLRSALDEPEPHEGSPALSRHAHASHGLNSLNDLNIQTAAMEREADDDDE